MPSTGQVGSVRHTELVGDRAATRAGRPTSPSGMPTSSPTAATVVACHADRRTHLTASEAERLEHRELAPTAAHGRHEREADRDERDDRDEHGRARPAGRRSGATRSISAGTRGDVIAPAEPADLRSRADRRRSRSTPGASRTTKFHPPLLSPRRSSAGAVNTARVGERRRIGDARQHRLADDRGTSPPASVRRCATRSPIARSGGGERVGAQRDLVDRSAARAFDDLGSIRPRSCWKPQAVDGRPSIVDRAACRPTATADEPRLGGQAASVIGPQSLPGVASPSGRRRWCPTSSRSAAGVGTRWCEARPRTPAPRRPRAPRSIAPTSDERTGSAWRVPPRSSANRTPTATGGGAPELGGRRAPASSAGARLQRRTHRARRDAAAASTRCQRPRARAATTADRDARRRRGGCPGSGSALRRDADREQRRRRARRRRPRAPHRPSATGTPDRGRGEHTTRGAAARARSASAGRRRRARSRATARWRSPTSPVSAATAAAT